MAKVLLINDTTDWYHYGCTATSVAIKEEIAKLGYSVTSYPVTETYKIKSFPTAYNQFISKQTLQKFAEDNGELISLIKKRDAIVLNGEGTLHGLNPAPASLLYVIYIAKNEFAKHVEIINHSAYPQHNISLGETEEAKVYKLVYNCADYIAVREPVSFGLMRKIAPEAVLSFDCMPLYIKNHYKKTGIKKGNELVIAGSATWLQLNIPSKEKGNVADYKKGLDGFYLFLQKMAFEGFKIKFLYGAKNYPAKDDREFIEYMENKYNINWEVYEAESLNDWLKIIEEASLLISGRFHHTIAAAFLGTQFIAFNSNTPKMKGLLSALDMGDVINYSDDNIFEKLTVLTEEKLSSNTHLPNAYYLEKLCNMALKNFIQYRKYNYNILHQQNRY